MKFYRNKKKFVTQILVCMGIFLVFLLMFIYGIGIFDHIIKPKLIGVSAVCGLILAFVMIKMLISLRDTSAQVTLSKEGISSKVTPLSKAAGLISWKDIIEINLNKVGGDTLVTLTIDKPDQYLPIIRKKLSAMVTKGAEDAQGNLLIYLTASTLDVDAQGLFTAITKYRDETLIHLQ